jgi:hypothetical protein
VPGNDDGTLGKPRPAGTAAMWKGYAQIAGVGDLDLDGRGDLIVRTPTGVGYVAYGHGNGGFDPRMIRFINGWTGVASIVGMGTFDNDEYGDLAVAMTNGDLYIYRGSPFGPYARTKIGSGYTGKLLA